MFLFVLLISGITVAIGSKDPVINVKYVTTERDKISPDRAENGLNCYDFMAEIAALREIVNKQGQEMNAIKQETKVLKEKTYQQGLLLNVLNQEKAEFRDKILKQEKQIDSMVDAINVIQKTEANSVVKVKEMQAATDKQGKNIRTMKEEISVFKETITNQRNKTKLVEEYTQTQVLVDDASDIFLNKQELSSEKIKKHFNSSTKNLMTTGPVRARHYKAAKAKRQTGATANTGIAFTAYLSHNLQSLSSGHTIKCDQILTNIGNGYNAHTGSFTVPRTGVYMITFFINSYIKDSHTYVRLVVDDRNIVDAVAIPAVELHDIMGGNTAVVELTAGESVWLEVFSTTSGQVQSDNNFRYVTFSGVFLFQ